MSVNPFDIIRTVLLAKRARRVVLSHPIALFTAAVAFDYLAQWNPYQNTDCGLKRSRDCLWMMIWDTSIWRLG
jgi:hypothetical protein